MSEDVLRAENQDPQVGETQDLQEETQETVSSWFDELPEDYKNNPSVTKFKQGNDLVKSYLEQQKLIGKKGIIPPGEDATEDEVNSFYNQLGRPEAADGYSLPEVDKPEGFDLDETMVEDFKDQAYKLGLTPQQVEGLYKWNMQREFNVFDQSGQSRDKAAKDAETELRREYGQAFEGNLKIAKDVIKRYGNEDSVKELDAGLGNNPHLIKMMVNIGKGMSDGTLNVGKAQSFTLSPKEAQKEINKILGNDNHPYYSDLNPEHKDAVNRVNDLYKMANPELAAGIE